MSQSDLFHGDEVHGKQGRSDDQALNAERFALAGEAELMLQRAWLDADTSDAALQQLMRELPWEQPQIKVYGKLHRIPRLQSWHGDPGATMVYSGKAFSPKVWHPQLDKIRARLESETGETFNSVLANLYRNGDDGMGWHADDEKELGAQPSIASVSIGATRNFDLRLKKNAKTLFDANLTRVSPIRLSLASGDLLIMRGQTQRYWQHSLPKTKSVTSPRLNLTFRFIGQ